jgi:hypothetical protein
MFPIIALCNPDFNIGHGRHQCEPGGLVFILFRFDNFSLEPILNTKFVKIHFCNTNLNF